MKYLFSSTKQELNLAEQIGRGREAAIYLVKGNPSLVAKIYHEPRDVPLGKLEYMFSNPPDDPGKTKNHISLAWIQDGIVDKSDLTMGYLMPRIENGLPIHRLYTPRERRLDFPEADWGMLHRCARHLARTMAVVHDKGYVIGDLHETNVLIQPSAMITFIDTDLFQVKTTDGTIHYCPSGKPEYLPPELQEKSLGRIERSEAHDRFALGVMLFYLLMEGTHPFQGLGEPRKLAGRIRQGLYPYVLSRKPPCRPPLSSPPFEILHPKIQRLFQRCFVAGHSLPEQRPRATEWADMLEDVTKELITCRDSAKHLYFRHSKRCPWCERKSLQKGRNPFPTSQLTRQLPGQQALPSYSETKRTFPKKPRKSLWRRMLSRLGILLVVSAGLALAAPHALDVWNTRKLRETREDMEYIALGFETYAHKTEKEYPLAKGNTIFGGDLVTRYHLGAEEKDRWGTPFRYASNGESYRLISYGSDKRPGKTRKFILDIFKEPDFDYLDESNFVGADIVMEDGEFLENITNAKQLPPLYKKQWEYRLQVEEPSAALAIHATSDGGYIVAGQSGKLGLLVKLDSQGELELQKKLFEDEEDSPQLSALQVTSTEEFLAAGIVERKNSPWRDKLFCQISQVLEWECLQLPDWLYGVHQIHAMQLTPSGYAIITGCVQVPASDDWKITTQQFEGKQALGWKHYYPSVAEGFSCGYDLQIGPDPDGEQYIVVAGTRQKQGIVYKLDSSQNVVWERSFQGTAVEALEALPDGGFLLFGGGERHWLARIDAEGNEVWRKNFQNANQIPAAFFRSENGDVVLAGHMEASKDGQGAKIWIIRLEPKDGEVEYLHSIAVERPTELRAITQARDGAYVVAGHDIENGLKTFLVRKLPHI